MRYMVPPVLILFAAAFIMLWFFVRRAPYLIYNALGFALFGISFAVQLSHVPADLGLNALASTSLYMLGVILFGRGLLTRQAISAPWGQFALVFALVLGGIAYFYYVHRNVLGRTLILNAGIATTLFITAWHLRRTFHNGVADRLLLIMLTLVGLHFVPRLVVALFSVIPGMSAESFYNSAFWRVNEYTALICGVLLGFSLFVTVASDHFRDMEHERDTDPLTGLLNRRGMLHAFQKWHRPGRTCWIALCDIDHFKQINDIHGHATGDIVLVRFAQLLNELYTHYRIIGRFGGEEFILILDDLPQEAVLQRLEALRLQVSQTDFSDEDWSHRVTCSIGCARLQRDTDFWETVRRADVLLYQAKREGRHRTMMEPARTEAPVVLSLGHAPAGEGVLVHKSSD